MLLQDILKNVSVLDSKGSLDIDISNIQYDSRKVEKNSLFICIKGFNVDGHKFINSAIEKGATAFLIEDDIDTHYIEGITFIKVNNTRKTMATISCNFNNNPSQNELSILGVTGTNGKTSITTFLREILNSNGDKSGLVGTIAINTGDRVIESKSTTPESLELQGYFREMIDSDCKYCAMEVSSHSLDLNRVDNTEFKIGVFTNLTPDHLDYHKNLDEYRKAKEKLFYKTTVANIINIDDIGGVCIYENIKNIDTPCYTYAIDKDADFMAKDVILTSSGVQYTLVTPTCSTEVFVPVPGKFTVYNTLAVIATCYLLNIPMDTIVSSLKNTHGVSGRFESIKNNKDITVIVDYAHTPDALENVLTTIKGFAQNDIITVFGCGGDRDSSKRPMMGKISQDLSDYTIITNDNPRTENPQNIINDILDGLDKENNNYVVIEDRELAIKHAIEYAKKGDVVLIAVKGHENYQILGTTKHH
ncbi:MAG: UDP-N-acetylmuramoyl-L-alanyl-D-glutamate--2,6-diaminopimelate ligase, partial [Romboutsia sp.]|nr:UDP-N-acetylmuramoyl-L-alanyl-D-glutamate--2,6-diaminopimelate ligase [Romboutsia sp.]